MGEPLSWAPKRLPSKVARMGKEWIGIHAVRDLLGIRDECNFRLCDRLERRLCRRGLVGRPSVLYRRTDIERIAHIMSVAELRATHAVRVFLAEQYGKL